MTALDSNLERELREDRYFLKVSLAAMGVLKNPAAATLLAYFRSIHLYYWQNLRELQNVKRMNPHFDENFFNKPVLRDVDEALSAPTESLSAEEREKIGRIRARGIRTGMFWCTAKAVEAKLFMGHSAYESAKSLLERHGFLFSLTLKSERGRATYIILDFARYREVDDERARRREAASASEKCDGGLRECCGHAEFDAAESDGGGLAESEKGFSKLENGVFRFGETRPTESENGSYQIGETPTVNIDVRDRSSSSSSSPPVDGESLKGQKEQNGQKSLEREVYGIWRGARLTEEDEESFSRQIKLAQAVWRREGVSDSDAVAAMRNYASVINRPDCWRDFRPEIKVFAKRKYMDEFLDANFSAAAHLRPDGEKIKSDIKSGEERARRERAFEASHWRCPACGGYEENGEDECRKCHFSRPLGRRKSAAEVAEDERRSDAALAALRKKFGFPSAPRPSAKL